MDSESLGTGSRLPSPTGDSLTEVWRAVEVMSPGPSGSHVDFGPVSFREA